MPDEKVAVLQFTKDELEFVLTGLGMTMEVGTNGAVWKLPKVMHDAWRRVNDACPDGGDVVKRFPDPEERMKFAQVNTVSAIDKALEAWKELQ